jgi:hypothetical protein
VPSRSGRLPAPAFLDLPAPSRSHPAPEPKLSRFAGVSGAGARRRNPGESGVEPLCRRERSGSPPAKSRSSCGSEIPARAGGRSPRGACRRAARRPLVGQAFAPAGHPPWADLPVLLVARMGSHPSPGCPANARLKAGVLRPISPPPGAEIPSSLPCFGGTRHWPAGPVLAGMWFRAAMKTKALAILWYYDTKDVL